MSTASAQQPGRLHDFPPVLVQVQGGGQGGSSGAAGYANSHCEVERPRKQIRFLASFLLLISIIQVCVCVCVCVSGGPAFGRWRLCSEGRTRTGAKALFLVWFEWCCVSAFFCSACTTCGARRRQGPSTLSFAGSLRLSGLLSAAVYARVRVSSYTV